MMQIDAPRPSQTSVVSDIAIEQSLTEMHATIGPYPMVSLYTGTQCTRVLMCMCDNKGVTSVKRFAA